MILGKISTTLGKEIIAWTRTSGKSLLAIRPVKVNTAGLKYANFPCDTVCIFQTPLCEATSYFRRVAREGKNFKPIFENPNSAFAQYYTSTQSGFLKRTPTLDNFSQYIFRNADKINVSADDYYAIIKECAKEAKVKALSDKSLKHIRKEFIDNSDKIYEWQQIFKTNFKGPKGSAFHKFYDEKLYGQAVNEYKTFLEQITGKEVLIGCPSRMTWGIESLGVFNNPKAYQDFDCILIGHGKGSSLIKDIASPNTWRFSDNNESVWKFIEEHAKDKKIMTLVCETNGVELANKTAAEMVDNAGVYMRGIGKEVLPELDAHSNPVKICKGGIRHIIGHIENSGKQVDIPANLCTKIFDYPQVVYYDLGLIL